MGMWIAERKHIHCHDALIILTFRGCSPCQSVGGNVHVRFACRVHYDPQIVIHEGLAGQHHEVHTVCVLTGDEIGDIIRRRIQATNDFSAFVNDRFCPSSGQSPSGHWLVGHVTPTSLFSSILYTGFAPRLSHCPWHDDCSKRQSAISVHLLCPPFLCPLFLLLRSVHVSASSLQLPQCCPSRSSFCSHTTIEKPSSLLLRFLTAFLQPRSPETCADFGHEQAVLVRGCKHLRPSRTYPGRRPVDS